MIYRLLLPVFLIVLLQTSTLAQTNGSVNPVQTAGAAAGDGAAVTLASQARLAITGGVPVSDVLLGAKAMWIAGGTKASGTATLKAKGTVEARLDLVANALMRSEIRNDTNGPDGQWIGADRIQHRLSLHNCWGPTGWFAPYAVVQRLSVPDAVLRYIGQELHNGVATDHLQFHRISSERNPSVAHAVERLSVVDVFLDHSSHLPLAVTFNTHPDEDYGRDIPVEIIFADYRTVAGVAVPFHIQRRLQGVLNLDLIVTSATINAGMADSEFALE